MKLEEFVKQYEHILDSKGIINPLYFVAKLISEIEAINLSNILMEKNFNISENTLNKLKKIVLDDYPLEYITNRVEFYGYDFYVDERVLIPRVETEDLIKIAIDIINEKKYKYIMDIGTGSGVIPIVLKKEFPYLKVFGIDISKDALEVAKLNAKKHGVNIEFINSDIFENVPKNILDKIEFIISNPPYVETAFFESSTSLKYEPKIALEAGTDGQDFFYNLSVKFAEILQSRHFLFETTEFNIDKTISILSKFGKCKIYKDAYNVNRFIEKHI